MNKDETLIEFLKGLRIVLNNASAYPKEHRYFVKSVENFKQKLDLSFPFLNPIKLNVTFDSLFIDGKYWDKAALYVELAQFFHLRKIKSIEFKEGLTIEELIVFLSSVSLPIREILRQGGIKNSLNKEKSVRILVEELDYSELLRGEGEESKDIWVYLFKAAVDNDDLNEANQIADNFEIITGSLKGKDLTEDEELRENLNNFLGFLKNKQNDKFHNCSKSLLKIILKDKNLSQEEDFNKIKTLFKDLNNEDLAEALSDTIAKDDNFNYLSFTVFSRLFDENTHKAIAPALEHKINNQELLRNNPKIRKRIRELFSTPDSSSILPIYRHALSRLFEENISKGDLAFDRQLVYMNYRFILLNLLAQEKNKQNVNLIITPLLKECSEIIKEENLEYLRFFTEVIDNKIEEDASWSKPLEDISVRIADFIENKMFGGGDVGGIEYFMDNLRKSSLGVNFYINKMFNEGKVNPQILKLFFKFFPESLPRFYEILEKKHSDVDLVGKIVNGLKGIDPAVSLEILKKIFYFSNKIIKIEILQSMQNIPYSDSEFLFSILKTDDTLLKKEALVILAKNDSTKKRALEELIFVPALFSGKNKLVMENIVVIEDVDLRDAEPYLLELIRKLFFWNRNIRKKALEVVNKWHARKD